MYVYSNAEELKDYNTVDDLLDDACALVKVKVLQADSANVRSYIYTTYNVEIIDVLYGNIDETTVNVNMPGGIITGEDAQGMIKEGREIAAIHKNMIVKIPMTAEGLKATKVLSKEGIKTNVTLIFSVTQALLAANAGATYVSPFLGRIDDISMDGMELVRNIADIFAIHGIETEIIAASVRNPIHVIQAAQAGADISTIPYSLVLQMIKHPLTDQGLEKFKADWAAAFGK